MENYLIDLFVSSAQEQSRVPGWLVRLYLSIFNAPPLGKTLRIDMVKEMLRGFELKDKRVLDVGCGIGDLAFLLAERGASVIGIELDERKVGCATKVAARWHFDGLRFIAGDVTKIDQMNLGQFDAIFCMALLEHIRDDVGLLQKMYSMLRPGSLFVMQVPSARRKTIPAIEVEDGHMRPGYIFEEVPELLASTGFRVIKSCSVDPLGLFYYWCLFSRIIPGPKARGQLFAVLAPLFISLIRLTSVLFKRPGTELCFLAMKE